MDKKALGYTKYCLVLCLIPGCVAEESDSVVTPPENTIETEISEDVEFSMDAPDQAQAPSDSGTALEVYTLDNRPAEDWAGQWGLEGDQNRFVWISNDSRGFLGLKSGELLEAIQYKQDGEVLKPIHDGKPLSLELRLSDDKMTMTMTDTESGDSIELPKESDPITGLVIENVDRQTAMREASALTQLLMKEENKIPYFEYRKASLRNIVAEYFDTFQEVEAGKYLQLSMNTDGSGFDAIRFKTPAADHNWDLFWEFVIDSGLKMHGWYILPREGDLAGFTGYEHAYNVKIDGFELPEKNIQIKQSLTGGRLKPETEYLIWFGNLDSYEEPYEIVLRLRFLPTE